MRTRTGKFWHEHHDQPLRCIDFIAPSGTNPHVATLAMEAAVPGLKLFDRGDGEVHGYVNTSLRPGGELYVSVQLFTTPCDGGQSCPIGGRHASLKVMLLSPGQENAMVAAVGEHPDYVLTGNTFVAALTALGFNADNPPRRIA